MYKSDNETHLKNQQVLWWTRNTDIITTRQFSKTELSRIVTRKTIQEPPTPFFEHWQLATITATGTNKAESAKSYHRVHEQTLLPILSLNRPSEWWCSYSSRKRDRGRYARGTQSNTQHFMQPWTHAYHWCDVTKLFTGSVKMPNWFSVAKTINIFQERNQHFPRENTKYHDFTTENMIVSYFSPDTIRSTNRFCSKQPKNSGQNNPILN